MQFLSYIWNSIKKTFSYSHTEFPAGIKVVFQVIYFCVTVWVTVMLVPYFDQKFQKSERKSVFYSSIIGELNGDTKTVLGDLAVLSKKQISKEKKEDIYITLRSSITKLHWRSVEFGIIFEGTEVGEKILDYQNSLSILEAQIDKQTLRNFFIDASTIDEFAYSSAMLLQSLAKDADVIISPQQIEDIKKEAH